MQVEIQSMPISNNPFISRLTIGMIMEMLVNIKMVVLLTFISAALFFIILPLLQDNDNNDYGADNGDDYDDNDYI